MFFLVSKIRRGDPKCTYGFLNGDNAMTQNTIVVISGQRDHKGVWIGAAALILGSVIGGVFSLLAANKGSAEPAPIATPAPPAQSRDYLHIQVIDPGGYSVPPVATPPTLTATSQQYLEFYKPAGVSPEPTSPTPTLTLRPEWTIKLGDAP
jgi:hypothetical protein